MNHAGGAIYWLTGFRNKPLRVIVALRCAANVAAGHNREAGHYFWRRWFVPKLNCQHSNDAIQHIKHTLFFAIPVHAVRPCVLLRRKTYTLYF